ncbi:unnamed protein product [Parnassius apollo]|uniref:(apollo) hypothetical protein n=1 Tax=Parnassius apollo TaxID=110799 RepID=A0A8S3W9J5_PARAO|nr:unnamed protein product [Parnassius apollo]
MGAQSQHEDEDINIYQTKYRINEKDDTSHSLQQSKIKKDKKNLNSIIEAIKCTMNPFDDTIDKDTLFNISTGKAASKEVADFLLNVKTVGYQ